MPYLLSKSLYGSIGALILLPNPASTFFLFSTGGFQGTSRLPTSDMSSCRVGAPAWDTKSAWDRSIRRIVDVAFRVPQQATKMVADGIKSMTPGKAVIEQSTGVPRGPEGGIKLT